MALTYLQISGDIFFIIAQIFNTLGVFAEKVIKDSLEFNSIKWEKVKKNKFK